VHYCIDRNAVAVFLDSEKNFFFSKKKSFLTLSGKKQNRASRSFLVGLSTKK